MSIEDEEVGLVVSADYNASIDPDATLVGVSFTADGVPVTDFTLTTSTGVFTCQRLHALRDERRSGAELVDILLAWNRRDGCCP